MSREIAIRVPSEIGAFVRQQQGSSTDVAVAIAKDVWKSRQEITARDPGPGEDRLKFRLPPRVLQFVRAVTHSRDATAAVRKLLLYGYQGGALPAPSRPVPISSRPPVTIEVPRSLPPRTPSQVTASVVLNGIPYGGDGHPLMGDAALFLLGRSESPVLAREDLAVKNPLVNRVIETLPAPVIAVGLPVILVGGGYLALKFFGGLLGGGAATGAKMGIGAAAAARTAPAIAAWAPKVAAGLGALL